MIEDMRTRGMGAKTQQGHIRAVKHFTWFIGRSPDTATPDELRACQLHMTDAGVATGTFNARIVSLRFFFGAACGREAMKARTAKIAKRCYRRGCWICCGIIGVRRGLRVGYFRASQRSWPCHHTS